MKSRFINTEEAASKRGAYLDAMRRNDENRCLYTGAQQAKAETWVDLARAAFNAPAHINYRQRFIAIKVANPNKARFKTPAVKEFEAMMAQYNTEKVESDQGVIYRVKV